MQDKCKSHKRKQINFMCLNKDCTSESRFGCVDCFGLDESDHYQHISAPFIEIQNTLSYLFDDFKVSKACFVDQEHQEYSSLLEKINRYTQTFKLLISRVKQKFEKVIQDIEQFLEENLQKLASALSVQKSNIETKQTTILEKVFRQDSVNYWKEYIGENAQPLNNIILKEQQDLLLNFFKSTKLIPRTTKNIDVESQIVKQIQMMEKRSSEFKEKLDEEIYEIGILQRHLKDMNPLNFQPHKMKSKIFKSWKKTNVSQPDNSFIVSVGIDNKIRKWNIETNDLLDEVELAAEATSDCVIFQSSLYVGCGNQLRIYNLDDLKNTGELRVRKYQEGDTTKITNVFRLDKRIITTDDQGLIKIWDLKGNHTGEITAHTRAIKRKCALEFNTDVIVSYGEDNFLRSWNLQQQTMLKEAYLNWSLTTIGFLREQNKLGGYQIGQLVLASEDGGLVLWNMVRMVKVDVFTSQTVYKDIVQLTRQTVACFSTTNQVHIFGFELNKLVPTTQVELNNTIYSIYSFTGVESNSYEDQLQRPIIIWR